MEIKRLVLSDLGTNCYIIPAGETEADIRVPDGGDTDGKALYKTEKKTVSAAVVIDPADDPERIISAADSMGLRIAWILLTHGHFDHTGAAAYIRDKLGAKVYIHGSDVEMLSDPVKSLSFFTPERAFAPCEADATVNDGDSLALGRLTFDVLHTPGHTRGSVCYLMTDPDGGGKYMFSGDTLFMDSIGRSDTYSGSSDTLMKSLERLSALTDDYKVLPGHGPDTTLFVEKKYNPFLYSL